MSQKAFFPFGHSSQVHPGTPDPLFQKEDQESNPGRSKTVVAAVLVVFGLALAFILVVLFRTRKSNDVKTCMMTPYDTILLQSAQPKGQEIAMPDM